MSTTNKSAAAVTIIEPTADVRVCVMDDGTVRILGDVSALRGVDARKVAYALMSAGAQV